MDLKPREKKIVMLTVVFFGLVLGYLFVVDPLIKLWDDNNKTIAGLKKKIDDADRLIAQEKSLTAKWGEFNQRSLSTDQTIGAAAIFDGLQNWVTDIDDLTITSFQPQWKNGRRGETQSEYEVRITGIGTLNSIVHLLFLIETDPLPINVTDLTLSSSDPNARNLTLNMRFSGLQLHTSKDLKPAPSAPKVSSNVVAATQGRTES